MTKVFLHIGLQKTGTSYLQNVCWSSEPELRDQGVTMTPPGRLQTFWLALDVRGRIDPHDSPRVGRSVEMLPGQLAEVGTASALVSHETLGSASPRQVRRLLEACAGHEVHVVVTARDIARQVPSLWQEGLKVGREDTLEEYVAALRSAGKRTGNVWRRLDLAGVLRRWAAEVPAERIHVVTVPGPGGPREALLERYCSVLGVDPAALDPAKAGPGNPGLGEAEAELLRRVNAQVPQRYRRRVPYGEVGKRWLAMGILARGGSAPIRLGRAHEEWCREIARESIDVLAELGCDVVGDPADLVPDPSVFADSSGPSDTEVLAVATRALGEVVEERCEQRLQVRSGEPAGGVRAAAAARLRRWAGRVRRPRGDA
ncbi:hypothetical protein L615_000500000690 [Nocardioides sp. J9]|uniref:hypothetical protein n=1 Tax=unclassified Nocardioides TaxID=2615069 RepID=UPI0004BA3D19|nr:MULTISPECIES: hypothetical protein [unclassified Nocardioides]TWG95125.1 hypothetical protein L615_000500000690 [Nocardioides sp. J9]